MHAPQLLLLTAVAAVTAASQQMPRFEFTQTDRIMLTWQGTWEVGASNMLAILSDTKKINIRVKVAGDTGVGLFFSLFYNCPKSASVDSIDLSSLITSPTGRCLDTMSIQLSALSDGYPDFELTMGPSKLSYSEVFRERVELWVKVEFSSGDLVSNKLFLWNLDPISSFSSASTSSGYTRRFLTDKAVSFMKQMPPSSEEFNSIQFVDPAISEVLRDAPDFFKSKMNLGAVLYFDSGSCMSFQIGRSFLLVNYHSKLDSENQKIQKLTKLNIADGRLWYSTCGLRNEAKRFSGERQPLNTIGICSIVSVSGDVEPYQRTEGVQTRIPFSDTSYSNCVSTTKSCEVISGANPNVTILSGMDSTAIVCPIICNDKTVPFRFYHDGRQLVGSGGEWTYVDGVYISGTENIVRFSPTLSNSHSGIYRCEAGSKSFSFNVKVISLPSFQSRLFVGRSVESFLGVLPPTVFAMEGEYLSYTCEVRFAGLQTVRIDPILHFVTSVRGSAVWSKLTLNQFRSKVNADDKNFFLNETSIRNDGKRLTVTVLQVPPVDPLHGTNFTHRFMCEASIYQPESAKVGMPAYTVQSGSDVVFIPRLTRRDFILSPNNSCSVQKCEFENGALFEFSLTDDLSTFLRDTGVEIVSFFRLDDDLLDNVKILVINASEIIKKKAAPQRLAYRIFPIGCSDQEVANELARRKTLTPVFNFRYKTNIALQNLRLDKLRHGAPLAALGDLDCRQDPQCFYSTDFDVESSLSFLRVNLTFASSLRCGVKVISITVAVVVSVVSICAVVIYATRKYFYDRDRVSPTVIVAIQHRTEGESAANPDPATYYSEADLEHPGFSSETYELRERQTDRVAELYADQWRADGHANEAYGANAASS